MSRTINLRIFKNEQLVGSRSFSQAVVKIGKLRSSDLHLEDDTVARMHAVLEVTTHDLRLVDLGSASGTTVNGQRVSKSVPLASGDSLHVGPFRLELQAQPAAAAIASMSPMVGAPTHVAAAVAVAVAPHVAPVFAPTSPRAQLPVDTSEIEQLERHVAEVSARYGNTVLDVQHVGQVRSRRRQAPAFLALGGLMLLAGGSIVASEVSQDWEAHQEATTLAQASGRPAPEAPGTGFGGLGLGLALLGLVPLGLGMARRQDVGLERYTLGEDHEASFHVASDGLPDGEAFPLVSKQGEDYVLRFTPHMRGHVTVNGERHELDALVRAGLVGVTGSAYALRLPRGAEAHIEHGSVAYRVASVHGGKAIARKNEADKPFWIYNAGSGAVLGSLLALVHLVPEDALNMNMDELVAENRYVGYMQQPDLDKEPEVAPVVTPDADQQDTGGKGQRSSGPEGKAGNPKSPSPKGIYAVKGPKTAVPTMSRNFDPEMEARTTGILGLMEQESGHFLASPYGSIAVGTDDADVWGGLTGTQVADAFGVAGLGGIGTGRGGGGSGDGTIGLGNVGTLGKGGGGGDRIGYGRGSGTGHSERIPKGPQIRQGKAKINGTIDKDVIRRIVRNHHNEIRHCYNQGLSKNPNLQGRVAVMFTIGPAGTVPSAAVTENTLGDRDVGNCVASAVRRWKFPKPQHGGSAMVTYPFSFSPG